MKRPFAFIGVVCLIASVIMSNLSIFAVSVTGVAALAVFLLSVFLFSFKAKNIFITFTAFAVAAVSVSALFSIKEYRSVVAYDNQNVDLTGIVTKCGYYGTYEKLEIKAENVNGAKHSFYIEVYSDAQTGLLQGDKIFANAKLILAGGDENSKTKNSSLADKIYFKAYDLENCSVCGENIYFKAVGKIKNAYKAAVHSYLPNELCSVILGMTIGEREGMSTHLKNCFNYSGTSHLLVVSGLHLTLWIALISGFFTVLRKSKLLNTAVTVAFIVLYLALTGFSVSVMRAGIMLLAVKLARLFNRGSDSLNSIGLSVAILMILNPFSVNSVSFLLSIGSTLGLILFSGKIHDFIYKSKTGRYITKYFFGRLIADSFAVSVSVSVFTLPVFILFFDMFPVLSFISNLFIIDLSAILMVLSVLGVALHFCGIFPVAKCLFLVAGAVAKAIIFIAEKIGMQPFSTVAVSSEYFRAFLVFEVAISAILLLLSKKCKKAKNILLPAVLAIGFVFTAVISGNFEFAHPSVDVRLSEDCAYVLVRDGYDSVFIGTTNKNASYIAGGMLGTHNLKTIGCLYVPDSSADTFAEIKNITESYPAESFAFGDDKVFEPNGEGENYEENVKSITVNGRISLTAVSAKTVAVTNGKENIYISCDNSEIKLLENNNKYDIIILSTDAFEAYGEEAKQYLKDETSQIITLANEQITVYPDIRKIDFSESF